jgi:hypothetical protein
MKLTWRRGFFRLWVALSILWIVAATAAAYRDTSIPSLTKGCETLLDFTDEATGQKLSAADVNLCDGVWRDKRLMLAASIFGPPLGLFLFGAVISWIAAGFMKSGTPL